MDKITVNTKAETKKAVRFLALSLAVLMVATMFVWGFQTSWGDVEITRLTLSGDDGSRISTLLYLPKNASNEAPAPCVVIFHGRSNQGHSNDTWSMEFARRGYVVLSPDLSGGGESDLNNRDAQATIVTKYANELPYVIKDEINLVGYSAGTGTNLYVYGQMPDSINSVCQVFGPFLTVIAGGFDHVDSSFCMIKSTADQYDWDIIGDPQACIAVISEMSGLGLTIEPGVDYERRDGLFRYLDVGGSLHQTGNISDEAISEMLRFVGDVAEAPIQRELSDTAWLPHQIFSGVAALAMLFVLAALINLLMTNPFFATIKNEVPVKEARKGIMPWLIDIVLTLVIPAILFVPVSAYVIKWTSGSTVLTSVNLNGIMGWLMVLALIGIVRMIIRKSTSKRTGEILTLGSYALGADGDTKIDWSKPAKALLIGIISILLFATWMWLLEEFLGINYQVWNLATYLKLTPDRITRSIPYILIIFVAMFTGNMNQRILPSTGNERKDMWIAVIVNASLTAGALFILLLIQYGGSLMIGTGETIIPQIDIWGTGTNTSAGSLDFAFGYCYMMGGTTGIVTYLYRKYGNIWVGVIPCAIFAGVFTLASFTLTA